MTTGPRPRVAVVVVPTRRLLDRLLRPELMRQQALNQELRARMERLEAAHADLERRHEDLLQRWSETNHVTSHLEKRWARTNHEFVTENKDFRKEVAEMVRQIEQETSAVAAIGWDHVAVARRLAALEDHLSDS